MWKLKNKLSFFGRAEKVVLVEKNDNLLRSQASQFTKYISNVRSWALGSMLLSLAAVSQAATISEGFTDSSAPGWVLGNNACLTASTSVACGSNNTVATSVAGNDSPGNGWLRLTSARENQKGFAYYNVPINPAQGLVVSFEYATYGGKGIGTYASAGPAGADGIAFFMFDASQTFKLGAFGSSLGYADNKTNSGGSGMAGGYFGVGFDEFGSWPDAKSHACGGPAIGSAGWGAGKEQWPNTIGVRGPVGATAATSYCWLGNTTYSPIPGGVGSVNFSRWSDPNDATNAYRKAIVTLTPNAGSYTIKVDLLQANGVTLTPVSSVTVPGTAPASLKFGFSASTGGAVNYHEIRNFSYESLQEAPPKLSITKAGPAKYAAGGTATYTVNVSNAPSANATTGDVGFIDTLPTGFTLANAPVVSNGFTCITGTTPNQIKCSSNTPIAGGVTKAVTFTVNVPAGLTLNSPVVNQVQIDPTKAGGDTAAASANCPQFNSALDVSSTAVWTSAQSTDKYCAASLSRIIEPKLSITKAGPPRVQSGGTAIYTVTVSNATGLAATIGDVSFIDTLPAGYTFASAPVSASNNNFTCAAGLNANEVVCTTSTSIPSPATKAVTFTVNVPSDLPINSSVLNQVRIDPTKAGGDSTVQNCTTLITSTLTTAGATGLSTDKQCAAYNSLVSTQFAVSKRVTKIVTYIGTGGIVGTTAGTYVENSGTGIYPTTLAPFPVRPSDEITYAITTKEQLGTASTATITETVPVGSTYFGPATQGWSCPVGSVEGTTCTKTISLAANATVSSPFTVKMRLTPVPLPSPITNTVTVPGSNCLVAGDCTASNIARTPVLSVSKSGPASLTAGGTATYTVKVSNASLYLDGKASAMATSGPVAFIDTLPAGFTFASAPVSTSNAGFACVTGATPNQVVCSTTAVILNSANGANAKTVTFTVNVPSNLSNGSTVLNTVQIDPANNGGDTRTPNCSTINSTSLAAGANIASTDAMCAVAKSSIINLTPVLTKSLFSVTPAIGGSAITSGLSTYAVKPGDKLTYKITATAGATATVDMTETVPVGTTYFGPSEGWSCAAGAVAGISCTKSVALAASTPLDSFFTVHAVSSGLPATISNNVTAPGTNCSTATSCAVSNSVAPKLSISKQFTNASGTAIASQPAVGDSIYYKVVISHMGGASTSGTLSFADTLPAGFSYDAVASATGGLTCSYVSSTRVITCSTSSVLAPQSNFEVIYKVSIGATASGNQTNAVILTALGGDTTTPSTTGLVANQSGVSTDGTAAQVIVNVKGSVALNVSKTLTNIRRGASNITTGLATAQVKPGDVLTYSIAAQSISGVYTGVVLTETLPANSTYTGTSEGWNVTGGVYTQSIDVAANTTVTKTFTVTVGTLAAGQMSVNNTVTAQNPSGSSNPSAPNCTSCSVSNPTPPLLNITKAGATNLLAGLSSKYTITLTNNGGTATSGVMSFTDLLPVKVWFDGTSQTSNGFICTVTPATTPAPTTAQTMTCTASTVVLDPGESVAVNYFVTAQSGASSTAAGLVNSASLVAGQAGGDTRTPSCSGLAAPSTAGTSAQSSDGMCAKAAATLVVGKTAFLKAVTAIKRGAVSYTSANLPDGVTTIDALPVMEGDEITYTITATNVDPADSLATRITETVPTNTTFASGAYTPASGSSMTWAGCSANAAAGTVCTLDLPLIPGKPANGTPLSFASTFVVTVGALPTTTNLNISNTMSSAYTTTSPEPPVCLTCTVNTPTVPKLIFSQQYTSTTVSPGGSVSLNVAIKNDGGSGTFGTTTFTDTLPLGLILTGSIVSSSGFTCTANSATPQMITCTSSSAISSGATTTVVIPLTADSTISGSNLNAKLVATAIANDPRTVVATCTSNCSIANAVTDVSTAASSTVNTSTGSGLSDAIGQFSNAAINVVQGTLSTSKTLYQIKRGSSIIFASPTTIVQPGDQLTYRISVTEASGTAATTTLTDVVPANTKYTGLSGEAWANCAVGSNAAAGTSCTQSVTALANRTKDVYFTVTVDSALPLPTTNIGNVVTSSAGTCGSDCSVTNPTPPQITVEKIANQAAIESLTTGTFTVKIYNRGGSATTADIRFKDMLPSGLAFVSATGTNFSCSAVGQVVTCDFIGRIAVGANEALTYTVRSTTAVAATGLINNVIVDPTLKGGDLRNNADTISSATNPAVAGSTGGTVSASGFSAKARVDITATVLLKSLSSVMPAAGGSAITSGLSTYVVKPGDQLTYKIASTTTSGATVTVNMIETVPVGTTYFGPSEGWSCSVAAVAGSNCTKSVTLSASAPNDTYFTVLAGSSNLPATISNNVTAPATSCAIANASGCVVSNTTAPKLALSKEWTDAAGLATSVQPSVGDSIYYKVAITHVSGGSTSGLLSFEDTLPADFAYQAVKTATGGLTCTYNSTNRVITCSTSNVLAPSGSFYVIYKVSIGATASGNQTNSVIMTGLGGDPTTPSATGLSPNQPGVSGNLTAAQAVVNVKGFAALNISKTLTNVLRNSSNITSGLATLQVRTGDVLTYNIAATSVSAAYAGVVLTEALPANTTFTGGSSEGWTVNGSAYTQSIDVAANTTVTKTFTVTVGNLAAGQMTLNNTVTAQNPSGSTNPSVPNCSSCSVSNPTPPLLSISKSGAANLLAGISSRYTVSISNNGGTATSGVVSFTDVLPVKVWFDGTTQTSNGFTCTVTPDTSSGPATSQTMTCTHPSLVMAPGASVSVSYFVTAQSSASTTVAALVNAATLVSGSAGGDTRAPDCSTLSSPSSAGVSVQSTDGMCAKTAATLMVGKTAFLKEITQVKRGTTTYTSSSLPAGVTTLDALPVMTGDELTYTITATNVDPANSLATRVTEIVPVNTTFASGSFTPVSGSAVLWAGCSAGSAANTQCTLDLPLIPGKPTNGPPFTLTATFAVVVATLPTTANLKISNTITSAYTTGNTEPPVCLTCTVNTPTVPKLAFSQQFTSTTVAPGGSVGLNVSLNNYGGSGTFGTITFTETLPVGLTLAGASISSNGFTCTANSATPQVVTCSSSSAIASGAGTSVAIPLTAANTVSGADLNAKLVATAIANDPRTVAANCASTCSISNATVGSSTAASSTVNTSTGSGILDAIGLYANAAINVTQGTLTTTKTLYQIKRGSSVILATPTSLVQPGDELTYLVSVTETSGTSATTTLTDVVPAHTKYTGLGGEAWVNCAVGSNAAAGTSCSQTVTALANRTKEVYFTVTVDATLPLPTTSIGNVVTSSAGACGSACSVNNPTPPQITVEKIATQTSIESLTTGTFTVKIYNRGGSVTTGNIKFADTLPTGLAFVSATGANFSCSAAGQVVSCTYTGTIAAGANDSVTYTVKSTAGAATGLINDVIVDATLKGGDVRSNTDTNASATNPTVAGSSGGTVSTSGFSAKAMVNITLTKSSISGQAKKVGGGAARGQAGVNVQLKNSAGQPVLGTNGQAIVAVTDANGNYQFDGLTPGQAYAVTFELPQNIPGTATAVAENTVNPSANGTADANTITAITAPAAGQVVPQQNSVIVDPSGVVYNAISRAPVAGAKVYIFAPDGSLVPNTSLDQNYGTANGAVTGANGSYKLYLKDSVVDGEYALKVVPPGCTMALSAPFAITCTSNSAYKASTASGSSSIIVDESTVNGAFTPNLGGGIELIQAQPLAPSVGQDTRYYTSFYFSFVPGDATSTSNGVANNHLPIDPLANLTISKTALTNLKPNEPASYDVTVANSPGVGTANGATVLEKIPTGLVLNSIAGTGWTCTKQDGSALNLPMAGEIVAKCTSTTPIPAGANANAIAVNVTPDGSVTAVETYSSVDPRGGSAPQTPQDPAQCSPTSACAKNGATVAQLSTGTATLFLQKTASVSTAEIGDSVMYTLMLEHKSGTPQSGTKIVDTLPLGFKYISGTVKMTRAGSVSSTDSGDAALGVTGVGPVLNFSIGNMVQGDLVTLTYRVRLAVGAQQGTGINRAIASTDSGSKSNEARATVKVTNGVFTQEGCVIGKVYLDCNHNGIQDQQDGDEPGVGGVRLYMEDGTYMVSDRQGKYSICGVQAATHVLKLDKTTLPKGAQLGITANRNALDPDSIFVDLKYGELHRADFLINNCTADVVNQVTSRTDKSGAPAGTYPQGNTKVPTKSQSFSSKEQSTNRKFDGEGK
jgi:uncharacterized repeat protein (TIGR01451 family)